MGGGFKNRPHYFSVNSTVGFPINHYSRISAIHRQPCHPDHARHIVIVKHLRTVPPACGHDVPVRHASVTGERAERRRNECGEISGTPTRNATDDTMPTAVCCRRRAPESSRNTAPCLRPPMSRARRLGRLGGNGHTLGPVALAIEPHPRTPVIQMTVLDIQSERLADPRTGQQQQTAQGIRPRTHTTRFVQKKPSLLAGEVRAIRMTVQFRPTHMLAGSQSIYPSSQR